MKISFGPHDIFGKVAFKIFNIHRMDNEQPLLGIPTGPSSRDSSCWCILFALTPFDKNTYFANFIYAKIGINKVRQPNIQKKKTVK